MSLDRHPQSRVDTYQNARNKAEALKPLMDPSVQGFFSDREAALIAKMVEALPTDDQTRRDAALELKALRSFQSWLRATITAGKTATHKLEVKPHG